jgi:SP family general alpha glucoside:H+ symporter-like MFS transporter
MASRRSSVVNGDSGRQASIIPTEKGHTLNQHDETFRKMSLAMPNLAELTQDAKTAADAEKAMSLRTALKMYPTAIFFSFGLSLAVIMEGYDTWLLGSFWALPAFAKKYGDLVTLDGKQTHVVSANWQTAFGVAVTASQVLGLMINGIVSEGYGYRKTMMGALVAITCFLFITFFSVNIQMLFAGYILSGLPW